MMNIEPQCKRWKCSRHFNENGIGVEDNERIYNNFTVTADCNKSRIPARVVLYILSWSGFLVSFMMRNDINIAMVSMVKSTKNETNPLNMVSHTNNIIDDQFDWSSTVQSLIFGSFYACYVLSQVVGGIATQYFGTKNIFGWSQFVTAICSLGIPLASSYHYSVVILLRSIQGFASGLTWPAMYAIVSYWIPTKERSRFMSSFQGFSVGIGLTYPLCGFIIKQFSWHYVFYTSGSIGILWCLIWWLLAFNSPDKHPRISCQEYEYIQRNIDGDIRASQGMHVPWKSIFKSMPAWSIGITTFGRIWVHYTFIMGGPSYMKNMLNVQIQTNGLLSGLPFLCSYLSSVVFCWIADWMMKEDKLTLTNIRKLFTFLSQVVPGLLAFSIGYCQNYIIIIIIWFIAVTLITASYAGAMANIVDIAPNLAGPVLAFAQTIHMSASFINPLINGLIIIDTSNAQQWRYAFILTAIIACATYIMFQIYGTADIQKWNYPSHLLPDNDSNETKPVIIPAIKFTNKNGDRLAK